MKSVLEVSNLGFVGLWGFAAFSLSMHLAEGVFTSLARSVCCTKKRVIPAMTRACNQLLYGATCDIILLTMALAISDSNLISTILQNNHTDSALPPVGQGGMPPIPQPSHTPYQNLQNPKRRAPLNPKV